MKFLMVLVTLMRPLMVVVINDDGDLMVTMAVVMVIMLCCQLEVLVMMRNRIKGEHYFER